MRLLSLYHWFVIDTPESCCSLYRTTSVLYYQLITHFNHHICTIRAATVLLHELVQPNSTISLAIAGAITGHYTRTSKITALIIIVFGSV